jgi:hypothetical protein
MKAVGWVLFLVGTLVASAAGAKIPPSWVVFGVGAVVATVGAVVLRREMAKIGGGGPVAGDPHAIHDLASLRAALDRIDAGIGGAVDASDDALKAAIEGVLVERVLPVVEGRLLLAQAHGVEAYARVFTPMASCERCLNRAWSAVVDGDRGEARAQVVASRQHLAEAVGYWPA